MKHEVPKPAASVICLRDGARAPEVLMVRRNEGMSTHGGSWVFPGGKVDPADLHTDSVAHVETAKRTAVREAWEEVGIRLERESLRTYSHWTTSLARPKRFATWFFVAQLDPATAVRVDGQEIVDSRWMPAADALAARARGEMVLPPATFITLTMLAALPRLEEMPAYFERHVVERFNPKIVNVAEGEIALYEGDAGYETLRHESAGARHRLQMFASGWHYERTTVPQLG